MPYKKGGGRNCAVYNCSNNQRKLGQWRDGYCVIHAGLTHRQCPCREPFRFCNIPQVTKAGDDTRRNQWLKAIHRLNLPRTRGVVSKFCFFCVLKKEVSIKLFRFRLTIELSGEIIMFFGGFLRF